MESRKDGDVTYFWEKKTKINLVCWRLRMKNCQSWRELLDNVKNNLAHWAIYEKCYLFKYSVCFCHSNRRDTQNAVTTTFKIISLKCRERFPQRTKTIAISKVFKKKTYLLKMVLWTGRIQYCQPWLKLLADVKKNFGRIPKKLKKFFFLSIKSSFDFVPLST